MTSCGVTPSYPDLPWAPALERVFDIQFFAEERTEPATPRKRQKSREEGQTAKSQDLSAAVVIISGLLSVYLLGLFVWKYLVFSIRDTASHLSSRLIFDEAWWVRPTLLGMRTFLVGWLPIGLCCALMAAVVMIYQVGFVMVSPVGESAPAAWPIFSSTMVPSKSSAPAHRAIWAALMPTKAQYALM